MILWTGRKVKWHGLNVIIVDRMDKKYVKVALESRQHMTMMVKREDIEPRK